MGFDILGEEEINNLFGDPEETDTSEEVKDDDKKSSEESENNETETTEVVSSEHLFDDDEQAGEGQPESVGSEKDKNNQEEKEDATTDSSSGSSPNDNFYSSIANALAVDGSFPNLDDETIKAVNDAESFSNLIEAEVQARLDEKTLRVSKALENGVEPSDIRKYERTIQYISSITENSLEEESEKAEELRRNLIYQDFLNKGYSAEKAQKLTERSIDAGNDVEDAKEALVSNKEYFQGKYNELLSNAQKEADAEKAKRVKETETMKNSILKDKQLFGDMEIDTDIRKKTCDAIIKPVYKDPETGEYMTSVQKYQKEHPMEFLKYVGLFMTLTNGFKDFDSFTKGKVKKEVKKGLRELELTLNNTRRNSDGSLKMVTGAKDDPESFLGDNFRLDI